MINLQKGQRIDISLSKVGVGLGWDPIESTGYDFDLDASAFMLGGNKKLPLVAHNRPLDESCLKVAFNEYRLKYPDYEFHCTLAASRRCLDIPSHQLHLSAAACGNNMENHHNAHDKAEACAWIAMKSSYKPCINSIYRTSQK